MFVIGLWVLVLCFDFFDIMVHLPKDERDTLHEAFADRNALWMMLIVLIAGFGYQTATSVVSKSVHIDPVILIALIAGTIVKMLTNLYLDKKD